MTKLAVLSISESFLVSILKTNLSYLFKKRPYVNSIWNVISHCCWLQGMILLSCGSTYQRNRCAEVSCCVQDSHRETIPLPGISTIKKKKNKKMLNWKKKQTKVQAVAIFNKKLVLTELLYDTKWQWINTVQVQVCASAWVAQPRQFTYIYTGALDKKPTHLLETSNTGLVKWRVRMKVLHCIAKAAVGELCLEQCEGSHTCKFDVGSL